MGRFTKLMKSVALIGQLGFSLITPPVVLALLAQLLVERQGWGLWVLVAAIVVGIVTGLCSAWQTLRRLVPPHDTSVHTYNQHD